MRKVLPLVIASFLTCASAIVPAQAQQRQSNWVQVAETQLGDRVSIDANSLIKRVRGRQRSISFRVRTEYGKLASDGTAKTTGRYTADCLSNTLRVDSMTWYDRSNQILKNLNDSGVMQPIQPGSIGEVLYGAGCSQL